MLLNEAASSLDAEKEVRSWDCVEKWTRGRTMVVVAYRLASVSEKGREGR